jgi:uncharacterized membrane protein
MLQAATFLFSLETVYVLVGVVLCVFAALSFRDRGNPHRFASGCFWLLLGSIFALGSILPHWLTGLLVLTMVAIDGAGRVGRGGCAEASEEEQRRAADRFGNAIFWPVLAIPILTFGLSAGFRIAGMDPNQGALVGLGFGGVAAMLIGLRLTRSGAGVMMREGHRLNDAMGSVNILPQLLASLGVIFTAAKVGDLIARGIHWIVPEGYLLALIAANCLGMALFTIALGNTFAAFPVIATGVLVPLIVRPFGVDPAMAGIISLTAGSSGTLMTIMAANFNVVPTALLNMRDVYGVIKFQLPVAITLWSLHIVVMWILIRW